MIYLVGAAVILGGAVCVLSGMALMKGVYMIERVYTGATVHPKPNLADYVLANIPGLVDACRAANPSADCEADDTWLEWLVMNSAAVTPENDAIPATFRWNTTTWFGEETMTQRRGPPTTANISCRTTALGNVCVLRDPDHRLGDYEIVCSGEDFSQDPNGVVPESCRIKYDVLPRARPVQILGRRGGMHPKFMAALMNIGPKVRRSAMESGVSWTEANIWTDMVLTAIVAGVLGGFWAVVWCVWKLGECVLGSETFGALRVLLGGWISGIPRAPATATRSAPGSAPVCNDVDLHWLHSDAPEDASAASAAPAVLDGQ